MQRSSFMSLICTRDGAMNSHRRQTQIRSYLQSVKIKKYWGRPIPIFRLTTCFALYPPAASPDRSPSESIATHPAHQLL